MNPERLQQIDHLLEQALDGEPGQRQAFLEQACVGDGELQGEVSALLASMRRPEVTWDLLP